MLPGRSTRLSPANLRRSGSCVALGTLRWLRRLDFIIEAASSRPLERIDRRLRTPLRQAVYEILFLDRIPAYASVSEAVEVASRRAGRRSAGFVNAVLRRISSRPNLEQWPIENLDPRVALAIETSHPDFLVCKWERQFGFAETRRLLQVNNLEKPLHLLTFEDRGGASAAAAELRREGVSTRPSSLSSSGLIVEDGDPFRTEAFQRGDLYVQDEVSQAAARVPLPEPAQSVCDLAAAPGGKTFSLLSSEPSLRCFTSDRKYDRVALLKDNSDRLGRRVHPLVADGGRPPFVTRFDRVVVDLPCSGTATLRKHPELKWRLDSRELERLSAQGLEILRGATALTRSGGLLVVITCSLEEEESVEVVAALCDEFAQLEFVDLESSRLGAPGRFIVGPGFWRALPADDHDGATVHVLRRTSSG